MKKLLILILLFLPIVVSAQIGRYPFYTAPVVSAPAVSNMVTDGTFDSGPDWGTAGWVVSSGSISFDGSSTYGSFWQATNYMIAPIATSTSYTLEFDIVSDGTELTVLCTSMDYYYIGSTNYTTGHITIPFTTGESIGDGGFRIKSNGDSTPCTIDNIELYE